MKGISMPQSVAVVTGASQGIGRSTAIRLARDFDAIALVARNRANLEETATAVGAAGAEPLVIDVDLSDPAAARAVVDATLSRFGRVDALLNIAGAVPQIDVLDMTDEQWDHGLALKLHGARRLTVAAWPALREARGSVVLISGNSALFPKPPTPRWARSTPRSSHWPRRSPTAASRTGSRSTASCRDR
ncbi:SDR family NAD(P)-dependent oxidoreductase [Streptomyces sp. NPDC014889]|uniref:SDR family NAD(P)-dependent oxidoreductase n=1 Tax=Streptomyces sp. NPDC014889 TaxID=3364928 RepID=UPI0036F8314B